MSDNTYVWLVFLSIFILGIGTGLAIGRVVFACEDVPSVVIILDDVEHVGE